MQQQQDPVVAPPRQVEVLDLSFDSPRPNSSSAALQGPRLAAPALQVPASHMQEQLLLLPAHPMQQLQLAPAAHPMMQQQQLAPAAHPMQQQQQLASAGLPMQQQQQLAPAAHPMQQQQTMPWGATANFVPGVNLGAGRGGGRAVAQGRGGVTGSGVGRGAPGAARFCPVCKERMAHRHKYSCKYCRQCFENGQGQVKRPCSYGHLGYAEGKQ